MPVLELILALMMAAAGLAVLARRFSIPYPILLVLGGLLLGLAPGIPQVELDPDVIFLVFLPPLLYSASVLTSIRDFRADFHAISFLAVGLVLVSTAVVGVVAHAVVPSLSWPAAFLLGAIVAPPDAIAATTVLQRLGAPRRLVAILEGESLLNDATALTAYRVALAALVLGAFSPVSAGLRFLAALGGVGVGLAVGWVVAQVRLRLDDSRVEIVISLLTPFAAYLPAEALGLSGVLATVAAGLYLSRRTIELTSSATRLNATAVWETFEFVLTGLVFMLIGLQLPVVMGRLGSPIPGSILWAALAVSGAAIAVRFAFIFGTRPIDPYLGGAPREQQPPWQELFVASWAGMRGALSLAAALALPATLANGQPFVERDLLVFLTFAVILVTLVGQGLTLPLVMRRLGVGEATVEAEVEEQNARTEATQAALARLDELADEWPGHLPLIDTLRGLYSHRLSHLGETGGDGVLPATLDPEHEQEMLEHRVIRRGVIDAERHAVQDLFDRGAIHDEVLRRIERDLDLEELRMEA